MTEPKDTLQAVAPWVWRTNADNPIYSQKFCESGDFFDECGKFASHYRMIVVGNYARNRYYCPEHIEGVEGLEEVKVYLEYLAYLEKKAQEASDTK